MLSSCSLGSLPSRTSSVKESSDITEETEETEETDYTDDTEESGPEDSEDTAVESGVAAELKAIAGEYLEVLVAGDFAATGDKFNLNYGVVLPITYECDKEFYTALFTNITYSYGSILTTDYVDYSLDVTFEVPDYQACVDTILEDEEFMNSVSSEWIQALAEDYESGKALLAYYDLKNNLVLEAIRRFSEGEYNQKQMITESFVFHDNGDCTWVCRSLPEIAEMLNKENYMKRLTYMTPMYEYVLIARAGELLVMDGTIKQDQLDAVLEEKQKEIVETQ